MEGCEVAKILFERMVKSFTVFPSTISTKEYILFLSVCSNLFNIQNPFINILYLFLDAFDFSKIIISPYKCCHKVGESIHSDTIEIYDIVWFNEINSIIVILVAILRTCISPFSFEDLKKRAIHPFFLI